MTPQDIIEEMNRQFDDAIIVSDVGQHQMFVSQYTEITEKKRMIMSGGLGTMDTGFPGANRRADRQSGQTGNCRVGRRRHADEYTGICDCCA